MLSQGLGERVTKKTIHSVLERQLLAQHKPQLKSVINNTLSSREIASSERLDDLHASSNPLILPSDQTSCLTRQLKLKSRLNDYWDEDLGSKMSCALYIREYILAEIDNPNGTGQS
ncbi:AAA-like domain-containing protein [Coleofasciculus sp.]|uniref:AAA-like domain-containing protein n=1 Tax=Coleofasciculus sp. TaxID=3100458 RepID=UPI003A402FCD